MQCQGRRGTELLGCAGVLLAQRSLQDSTRQLQRLAIEPAAAEPSPELQQALGALFLLGSDAATVDFGTAVTSAKLASDAIRRLAGISLL